MLLSHPLLFNICSYYHQATKNGLSSYNYRKHSKLIKNFGSSSPPSRENNYKYSKIRSTKLSPHQTKQSESFQETTSFTVVTSSEQDLKDSQLIIIPCGFYVETSRHHSNNLQRRRRHLRSRLRSRLRCRHPSLPLGVKICISYVPVAVLWEDLELS